jgi:hypothetical protein
MVVVLAAEPAAYLAGVIGFATGAAGGGCCVAQPAITRTDAASKMERFIYLSSPLDQCSGIFSASILGGGATFTEKRVERCRE